MSIAGSPRQRSRNAPKLFDFQHVVRSGDKIQDLQATIEEFGRVGKNLLKDRKITAPCWIVVTSQEKLDEVVAAIDSKRVELAKLQDRFRYRGSGYKACLGEENLGASSVLLKI